MSRQITITFFLFFAIAELAQSQGRWIEANLPVSNPSLFRISFADTLHGCIAGGDGTFLYTEDGGTTWVPRMIPTPYQIRECKLVSPSVAWALATLNTYPGLERTILRSTDKGQTWQHKSPSDTLSLVAACFVSANVGLAITTGHYWATTDGGTTWRQRGQLAGYAGPPNSLQSFDDSVAYIGGGCGMVVGSSQKTTDGGSAWTVVCPGPPGYDITTLWPERFIDGRIGTFLTSYSSKFGNYFAINLTWNKGVSSMNFDNSNPHKFGFAKDSLHAWLLRNAGQIRRTTNGGVSWKEDTLVVPIKEILYDTYEHQFALGSGRLFRFDPTATEVGEDDAVQSEFRLCQNYPNPFNPTTEIRYRISEVSHVTLKVFDVLGREVATLVNEVKAPGEYEVQFDAGALSSGIYFYRLTSGNFSSTKKLVLMK